MNFLKASIILSFASCLIFAGVCIVLNCLGIEVSDTLIEWFFKVFGVEFAAAAAVRMSKYIIEKQKVKDKVALIKENNLEVEKEDLETSKSDQYTEYGFYDDESVG